MLQNKVTVYNIGPLDILSVCLLFAVLIIVMTFLTWALTKFIVIVSRSPFKKDLNRCLIFVQILCILLWVCAAVGLGVIYTVKHAQLFEYRNIYTITVLDLIMKNVNTVNFSIIWLILFRSSQAAILRNKSQDTYRISFL